MNITDRENFRDFVCDAHTQIVENNKNYLIIKKDDMVVELQNHNEIDLYTYNDYILENIACFKSFKERFIRQQEEQFIEKLIKPKNKKDYGFIKHLTEGN